MKTINRKIEDLRLGAVIAEDIFANTQYPIIHKDTKIKSQHLRVFELFNLQKVLVYNDHTKELNEDDSKMQVESVPLSKIQTFETYYHYAVNQLKKEFSNWGSGGAFLSIRFKYLLKSKRLFILSLYWDRCHCIGFGEKIRL